jgi:hypothetical protein
MAIFRRRRRQVLGESARQLQVPRRAALG